MKLHDEIVELINNGVARFDPIDEKNVVYIEAKQEEKETIVMVQNERVEPDILLELIKTYKDLNPWIYEEIFIRKADLLK